MQKNNYTSSVWAQHNSECEVCENALLTLENVQAGYSFPVVGPVSFAIAPGEVVGLGGFNGAGKSTILRSITGQARVFSGIIHRSRDLTISHQWQRPESPPELALLGRELFALLGADPAKAPKVLNSLLKRPLYRMSGGQFQMLHTLACLCSPSKLVLMDEPTNNLDGVALEELSKILSRLEPERSVLLVSHEHSFLERHCTKMVEVRK